jgi:hypothetical protein
MSQSYVAIAEPPSAGSRTWPVTFLSFRDESATVSDAVATDLVNAAQEHLTRVIQRWIQQDRTLPPTLSGRGASVELPRQALVFVACNTGSAEQEPEPYELLRVPDTAAPAFSAEARRQSRLIAQAERTGEAHAEAEAWFDMSDKTGWTP